MMAELDEAERANRLTLEERFVLRVLRAWVCCRKAGLRSAEPVVRVFAEMGIPEATRSLDTAMTSLAAITMRPLDFHCGACPCVSADECQLLVAAATAQRGDMTAVFRALRGIVPPDSMDRVIIPLIGLGWALAQVGIVLPESEASLAASMVVSASRSASSHRHPSHALH